MSAMLARSSQAVCSARTSALCIHPKPTPLFLRSNSSAAASTEPAPEAAPAPRKRTIPLANVFGDIEILSSRAPRTSTSAGSRNDFRPDLSWLGDDEFDGKAPIAQRMARRQLDIQNQSGRKSTAESPVDAQTPTPLFVPSRVNVSSANSTQHNDAERTRPGRERNDRQRTSSGNTAAAGGQYAEMHKERERPANRDRVRETRKTESLSSQPRTGEKPAALGVKKAMKSLHASEAAEDVRVTTVRPSSSDMPPIQTTDLEKLFGTADVSQAQPALSSTRLSGAARRVQHVLETTGGEYSRYLPPNLGRMAPEQLGPIAMARLHLGRRREAGLRMRQTALDVVQQMAVTKAADDVKQVTA